MSEFRMRTYTFWYIQVGTLCRDRMGTEWKQVIVYIIPTYIIN